MYSGLRDGSYKICRNCVRTIEAIESRVKNPEREGDILKISGDELDDYADNARYGYYSWATAQDALKPRELEVAEHLADLYKVDPTSAMLHGHRMEQELKKDEQPHVYAGTARQRMRNLRNR